MRDRRFAPRRPAVRYAKDYELEDVVALYRMREWSSWGELLTWLRTKGPACDALTPGEVARMVADFSVLNEEHVPFVRDPATAYEVAQTHRRSSSVLEALQWIERTQALMRDGEAA